MGSIGSEYSAKNGAQMQRRNFLSSVFAALVAAKAVNAEERKLSPEVVFILLGFPHLSSIFLTTR